MIIIHNKKIREMLEVFLNRIIESIVTIFPHVRLYIQLQKKYENRDVRNINGLSNHSYCFA